MRDARIASNDANIAALSDLWQKIASRSSRNEEKRITSSHRLFLLRLSVFVMKSEARKNLS
jgi:hypothetical protein